MYVCTVLVYGIYFFSPRISQISDFGVFALACRALRVRRDSAAAGGRGADPAPSTLGRAPAAKTKVCDTIGKLYLPRAEVQTAVRPSPQWQCAVSSV